MNKNSQILGLLLAIPVITIWGITFVCTKALLSDFSALEILFIRYFAAWILLWIIYPHKLKLEQKSHEIYFVLAGLSGVTVYQLMENMAIHFTNASNVSIIVSICPMFTAIIMQLVLKEKSITANFVLGFLISIAGVMLVSFNGVVEFHLNPLGDVLAMISGISWGFYSLFISLINRQNYNPIASIRKTFFYALLFMIPMILSGGFVPSLRGTSFFVNFDVSENIVRFTKVKSWLNLLFLGWAASAFCFIAWNKACSLLGTVYASIGIYLIPVVTVIFAFIFLDERLSIMGGAGAVCTLAGVILSGLKKSKVE